MSSEPFERYRYNPARPITLPRLIGGTLVAVGVWMVVSLAIIFPAMLQIGDLEQMMSSTIGMLAMLLTFGGIWIGVWVAQRFVHNDPFGNVLGAEGRLNWSDFNKGFVAVFLTSILSELFIYAIRPEFTRTDFPISTWLMVLIPMLGLCLLQTSAEELLFRGYLTRGLANRFRSPWIWAVLPGIGFVLMHYSGSMSAADLALVFLTIGALTIVLVWLVYATGNLGAAFGVHMGNNLFAFMLVGHQDGLTTFSLYKGAPVGDGSMTTGQMTALVLTGWVCVALTWWLLASRRSPLCIRRLSGQTIAPH